MNSADWQRWLENWLARHPLKSPTRVAGADYTRQVMARICAPSVPVQVEHRVPVWTAVSVCLGIVAGSSILFFGIRNPHRDLVQQAERNQQILLDVSNAIERHGDELDEALRMNNEMLADSLSEEASVARSELAPGELELLP